MKKFLIHFLKYGVLLLVIGNIMGFGLQYFLKKGLIYKPSFLVNNFSKKDSLDYIILGSSRGLTTLNTQQIDLQLNTKGLNLSMDDTDLKTHLLMLQHFVNNGYYSKVCVLNIDEQNFKHTNKSLGHNDYKFVPFGYQNHVKEHYKKHEQLQLKPLYHAYWFPLIAYGYYNLELLPSALISAVKPQYKNRFDSFGNYAYPNLKKTFKNKKKLTKRCNINNPILKEIYSLAQQNNIQLILYIAPLRNTFLEVINCKYPLINHSDKIKDPNLFYDNIHVNKKGQQQESVFFAEDFIDFLTL